MPGFNTHYFFGTQCIEESDPSEVLLCCKKHKNAFALGLQGPDIFFYFAAAGFSRGKNLGSLLHVEDTGLFFQNMWRYLRHHAPKGERSICTAYLAGFLGHYTLDCKVHPFIYARTDYAHRDASYFGQHVFLESDIDVLLLEKFTGKKPSQFNQAGLVYLTPCAAKILAKMLHYAVSKTYGPSFSSRLQMYIALKIMPIDGFLLRDRHGCKKAWIRKLENYIPGFPLISPLITSDTMIFKRDPFNYHHEKWQNPWDPADVCCLDFFDLYEESKTLYKERLSVLNRALVDGSPWSRKAFFQAVGNYSYHSGLDCEEEKRRKV